MPNLAGLLNVSEPDLESDLAFGELLRRLHNWIIGNVSVTLRADEVRQLNINAPAGGGPINNVPGPKTTGTQQGKTEKPRADPFVPLTSWADIFAALNEVHGNAQWKNSERTRGKIRKLNLAHSGPSDYRRERELFHPLTKPLC